MAPIKLYLNDLTQGNFICTVHEGLAMRHFVTVREEIQKAGQTNGPKQVVLKGAAPSDVSYIVSLVQENLWNSISLLGGWPMPAVIGLNRAMEVLNLKPRPWHVERQIVDYLRDAKITRADMVAIEQSYSNDRGNKIYKKAIQRLAHLFEDKAFTPYEEYVMIEESEKHPDLDRDILAKMAGIRAWRAKQARQEAREKREAREKKKEENRRAHARFDPNAEFKTRLGNLEVYSGHSYK